MTPEQLKASILQYAIQGKLVEQRPEEGRNIHSVEPCFRCRLCVVEEQQIGGNGSIGAEHRAGQSDNGVQIKLANELFLDVYLRIVQTEQKKRCLPKILQSMCGLLNTYAI